MAANSRGFKWPTLGSKFRIERNERLEVSELFGESYPNFRGESKTYLKPPPSKLLQIRYSSPKWILSFVIQPKD